MAGERTTSSITAERLPIEKPKNISVPENYASAQEKCVLDDATYFWNQ
jgi:hypothetical protein